MGEKAHVSKAFHNSPREKKVFEYKMQYVFIVICYLYRLNFVQWQSLSFALALFLSNVGIRSTASAWLFTFKVYSCFLFIHFFALPIVHIVCYSHFFSKIQPFNFLWTFRCHILRSKFAISCFLLFNLVQRLFTLLLFAVADSISLWLSIKRGVEEKGVSVTGIAKEK